MKVGRHLVLALVLFLGAAAALLQIPRLLRAPAGPGPAESDAPAADGRRGPAATLPTPIVLIGLDGADWQIADPLMAQGRLPHLARLKSQSVWGHLRSFEPILSPLLWTTAVTGKPPDEHGIIDFLVPDAATGRRMPITSRARRVPALWNIFSDRGLSTDFIAWWASWPAETVNGRMVSDRVAYSLFDVAEAQSGLTSPDSLWSAVRGDVVADSEIGFEQVARFLDVTPEEFAAARRRARQNPGEAYKEPINHLTKILASTRSYQRIALRLLRDGQPDLFGIYYQGIDEVCHRFAHFAPPRMEAVSPDDYRRYHRAVDAFYVYQDELLGELLAALWKPSTVIVLSDHGFQNGPSRPADGPADIEGKPGKWHRLYGVVMVSGPGIAPGRLDTATLLDIAPTVLALAGLPLADDMKGAPLVAGRRGAAARVASYERRRPPPDGDGTAPDPEAGDAASEAESELLRNLASLGYIGAGGPVGASAPDPPPPSAEASLGDAAPRTVTAHTNLAALLMQKGDLGGAESELRAALDLQPSYFPALMMLSQSLVRQGKVEDALYATRRAVATSEDAEPAAYVQLALLAARAGQSGQAAHFLEALRDRRPKAAGIHVALGVLESGAGDSEAAARRFRAALEIEPASTDAMGRLFQIHRQGGREADLESAVRRALRINDRSVLHHNWLGLILARKGDAAGAETEFRRALDLAPDFGGTMANLGSLYGRTGRLEEASAILARALRIEPDNLEARVNLGAALAKLGRLEEAIASLEEARRRGIRSTDLLNAIGLAYAQQGRTGQAIEALEESLTLSPSQPAVTSLLRELKRPG